MCSISGFVSSVPLDKITARTLCTALLYYGQERGSQSAGVYWNNKILKRAMEPYSFTQSSEFFNLFEEPGTMALCHTRQPTCGGLGDQQAQPFRHGNTISIHNGWLMTAGEMKRSYDLKKKSGVDSELFASFIDQYGIMLLPEFLDDSVGPSAIAAIVDNVMYLARYNNPTCYYNFRIPGGSITVFASTGDILMSALKYTWLMPIDATPIQTTEGILYRIDPYGAERLTKKPFRPSYHRSWPSLEDYTPWGTYVKGKDGIYRHVRSQNHQIDKLEKSQEDDFDASSPSRIKKYRQNASEAENQQTQGTLEPQSGPNLPLLTEGQNGTEEILDH